MRLNKLMAYNFRCLRSVTIEFGRLTVLIGENDAGKSSTLDLLEMLFGTRRPDAKDFFTCAAEGFSEDGEVDTEQPKSIEAIGELYLDENDLAARPYALDGLLSIKKTWTLDGEETLYRGRKIQNPILAQDFTRLKKAELEGAIASLEPESVALLKNNDERIQWLQKRASSAPTTEEWVPAPPRWGDFLPRFERYRAIDYSSPDSMVMKTLRQVYEQVIFQQTNEDGTIGKILDKRLQDVKSDAETKIRERVQELLKFIKRYAPQVKGVSYDPVIDFVNGLRSGEFQIDDGRGLHYLSRIGDGTKRRVFMATLDWDRQISMDQADSGAALRPIIRGYDEPDANLHYEAQRLMYRSLSDIAEASGSQIQVILCTHSLTMIDRAPAKSINLLRLRNGCTIVERLETDDDPEIELFLTELAQQLGITNTVMFYERCFVLVEGETEENALPILYRSLYKRSLLEDGIRLIMTKSNGAVKEFLRLLSKNRMAMTIVFLDSDTELQDRGEQSRLTQAVFREAGFDEEFIKERIIYVGLREFEDAFGDQLLAAALQVGWPRDDEQPWSSSHVAELRAARKFSSALGKLVYTDAAKAKERWSKPEFGKRLGRVCKPEDVPDAIRSLFDLARSISGCNERQVQDSTPDG